MKEFDLNSIGRRAPYAPPKDGFFEEFSRSTLTQIDRRATRRHRIRFGLATSLTAAAAVAIVMWGSWSMTQDVEPKYDLSYSLSYLEERFNSDVESYVEELSVEDIESVLSETESDGMFYSNL